MSSTAASPKDHRARKVMALTRKIIAKHDPGLHGGNGISVRRRTDGSNTLFVTSTLPELLKTTSSNMPGLKKEDVYSARKVLDLAGMASSEVWGMRSAPRFSLVADGARPPDINALTAEVAAYMDELPKLEVCKEIAAKVPALRQKSTADQRSLTAEVKLSQTELEIYSSASAILGQYLANLRDHILRGTMRLSEAHGIGNPETAITMARALSINKLQLGLQRQRFLMFTTAERLHEHAVDQDTWTAEWRTYKIDIAKAAKSCAASVAKAEALVKRSWESIDPEGNVATALDWDETESLQGVKSMDDLKLALDRILAQRSATKAEDEEARSKEQKIYRRRNRLATQKLPDWVANESNHHLVDGAEEDQAELDIDVEAWAAAGNPIVRRARDKVKRTADFESDEMRTLLSALFSAEDAETIRIQHWARNRSTRPSLGRTGLTAEDMQDVEDGWEIVCRLGALAGKARATVKPAEHDDSGPVTETRKTLQWLARQQRKEQAAHHYEHARTMATRNLKMFARDVVLAESELQAEGLVPAAPVEEAVMGSQFIHPPPDKRPQLSTISIQQQWDSWLAESGSKLLRSMVRHRAAATTAASPSAPTRISRKRMISELWRTGQLPSRPTRLGLLLSLQSGKHAEDDTQATEGPGDPHVDQAPLVASANEGIEIRQDQLRRVNSEPSGLFMAPFTSEPGIDFQLMLDELPSLRPRGGSQSSGSDENEIRSITAAREDHLDILAQKRRVAWTSA